MLSHRRAILPLFALLAAATESQAAARVFVSVSGSDSNNCSVVTTPCRTFDAAVAQVDPGGEVIVIASGSYGGVVIGKSVRIDVPTGVVAFTAATIEVNAGAGDVVTLRGLTSKALTPGSGTGFLFTAGKGLQVENCVMDGWQFGAQVTGAGAIVVLDTIVRNTGGPLSGAGIRVVNANATVVIDKVRIIGSGHDGLVVGAGKTTLRNSVAINNINSGAHAINAGSVLTVENSLLANNANGLSCAGNAIVRVLATTITGNGTGIFNSATLESFGTNAVRGNTTNTTGAITAVALQ
jgi:hypothetical protein